MISLPEEKREKGKRYVEKRKYPLCSLVSGPHPSENKNPFLFSSASTLPSYNPPPPPRYLSPLLASSLSTILPFALPRNSGTVPFECVEESHFRPRVRYQANPLGNLLFATRNLFCVVLVRQNETKRPCSVYCPLGPPQSLQPLHPSLQPGLTPHPSSQEQHNDRSFLLSISS